MNGAWWTRAKPGDRIVCVDAVPGADCSAVIFKAWDEGRLLQLGRVYTIVEVHVMDNPFEGCAIGFVVAEIDSRFICNALCFRPVERDRTARGMAALNRLLRPARAPAPSVAPSREDVS